MKMVGCDVSLLIERKGDYFDEDGGLWCVFIDREERGLL